MKRVGYARVSTKQQIEDRQVLALMDYGLTESQIAVEKQSGKDFSRPVYHSLKSGWSKLEDGDELVIQSIDRLGRNKAEMQKELQYFKENGIKLRVLTIPTTLTDSKEHDWLLDMVNNVILEVYVSLAEQERVTMLERQKEAYAALPIDPVTGKKLSAKTGRAVGRPTITYPSNWETVYQQWKAKGVTAVQAMQTLGLKKTKFYELVKKYEEEQSNEQGK